MSIQIIHGMQKKDISQGCVCVVCMSSFFHCKLHVYPGAFKSKCITSEKQNKMIFTIIVTACELEIVANPLSGNLRARSSPSSRNTAFKNKTAQCEQRCHISSPPLIQCRFSSQPSYIYTEIYSIMPNLKNCSEAQSVKPAW